MLPPPAYTEARLRADYHLQGEIVERGEIRTTPTHVPVRCRVLKVFRGADLEPEDIIMFTIPVCRTIEEIPASGTAWTMESHFRKARYFEAFMDGRPPSLSLALDEWGDINRPSRTPKMKVPTERQVELEWKRFKSGLRARSSALGNLRDWIASLRQKS